MSPPARTLAIAAALFVVALALYAGVVGNDFVVLDDPGYLENRWVRAGLTWEGVQWAFTRVHSGNWHPLTWLAHMLDVQLFGRDPRGHHLVSAGLHALSTALLYLFLQTTTARRVPSALVALVFAVHPLRVESVAWVAERKDVLSAFFFFVTLLLYAHHARRPSWGRLALVCVAAGLGLLAKPMLVTLPCVLLLLDLWPLGRWRPGASGLARLVREKVPLVALALGSIALTLVAQTRAMQDLEALPFGARLANALECWVLYAVKFLWPTELAVFYPHPAHAAPGSSSSLATLAAALLVVGTSAWAWSARRRHAWLTTGWFWYAGMLVPVIGIVQVGGQRMADRYAYLPLVGFSLVLVFGADALVRSPRARRALTLAGFAAAGLLARLTWLQVRVWEDSGTLFHHALAVTERNSVAHANLGGWYLEQGEPELAVEQFTARLAFGRSPGMLVNLGVALQRSGRAERAAETYEEALRLDPGLFNAHANLASILLARGDAAGAIEHYQAALRQRPNMPELLAGLERARRARTGAEAR